MVRAKAGRAPFAPIQKEAMTLEPGRDYVFRYRFLVHEGKIDRERTERTWQDLAEPPRVDFEAE